MLLSDGLCVTDLDDEQTSLTIDLNQAFAEEAAVRSDDAMRE